jgi:UrcA family protein
MINADYREIHMYSKTVVISAVLGAAAIACPLFAGNVAAQEHKVVSVAIHVSTQGLDLSQPTDARTFYTRLKQAAWTVCTRGNRVDLVPSDNPGACAEKALAGAVRSARVPTLTQIYLANHTIEEAVARGILVPAQIAAK